MYRRNGSNIYAIVAITIVGIYPLETAPVCTAP